MSDRRLVWSTLAELLTRLERALPGDAASLSRVEEDVRKLGRTQFKANALAEEQAARWERALTELQAQQERQAELTEQLVEQRVAERERAWIDSLLPVLDGLDHALESGQRSLRAPAEAHEALASWLEGLQLVRRRLLDLLKEAGVAPIPTLGRPFNPHLHVAVATTADNSNGVVPGTIVAEERRGYRTESHVLRYADVVVYRPDSVRPDSVRR